MHLAENPVFRFAPGPNGLLHLGHAYSALFTAHWAAQMGGQFLLRIEDVDVERCKPEFTKAIFEDLLWLGLHWPEPVMRQSDRFEIYAEAAATLNRFGLLYPCFCSRAEIKLLANGKTDPDGAPVYPGTCRHLSRAEVARRLAAGEPANWRLKMDEVLAKTGPLTFTTAGPTPADRPQIAYARPERWGDVVIQRKHTPTSYHLSVVIDDDAQAVTHVTRGRDMEASTDIHVLLQFVLGLASPIYTFHKLIFDDTGQKLAKSIQSQSLRSLREAGRTPEDIRHQLGF